MQSDAGAGQTDESLRALQQEIDAIDWYHEFDFGSGLRATTASDTDYHRKLWKFIESRLGAIDFENKTVLDIGCWDGYWSFYAERRGAKRVLATDDVSQNWAQGGGLRLAKRLLRSRVETNQSVSIYELSKLGEKFDIILCLGVYYHLVDPFAAFAQVRHCLHPGSIAVFEGDVTHGVRPDCFYWDPRDSRKPVFVPTAFGLRQMLRAAYMDGDDQSYMQPAPPPSSFKIDVSFSKQIPGLQDPESLTLPQNMDRMITVAKSIEEKNPLHAYRPPFGLHAYDLRYR